MAVSVQQQTPSRLNRWLGRPVSGPLCILSWLVATVCFVVIIQALGGPYVIDSPQSLGSTLAIAHGQLRCAFPSGPELTAPLYPFLSGGIIALFRVGHGLPFPSRAAMGPNCSNAFSAINSWVGHAHNWPELLRFGYVGWIFLLTGVVVLVRTVGRGLSGWEPMTVIVIACLPPVWLTLESSFHPQDLIAIGLCLLAISCSLRGSWLAAGILVVLGVFAQQFAILVAIPLLFVAWVEREAYRFFVAAAGTALLVMLLLFAGGSPRAVGAALIGTGNTSTSDSLVMTLHLRGAPLVFLSRVVPVLASLALSWCVARVISKSASQRLDPQLIVALVAVSLSLRLAFEQNMFGYYFMALVVCLVLLDVIAGQFRSSLVAWVLMLTLTYVAGESTTYVQLSRVSWGFEARQWMAPIVLAIAVAALFVTVYRHAKTAQVLIWLGLVLGTVLVWPSTHDPFSDHLSRMFWQVVLVAFGVLLATGPLLTALSRARAHDIEV